MPLKVALLTAGKDPHYALGLAPALADLGIEVEVVGNSEMEAFPGVRHPNIRFLNLIGDQSSADSSFRKVRRVLAYYVRLLRFAIRSESTVFHILWPNKFVYFDRTLLNLYYRALGKKLVFTAHNVNTEDRDQRDSRLNRTSLRIQYHLMRHVFVHTSEMQKALSADYGIPLEKLTVLTFPVNNVTPRTALTRETARTALNLGPREKVILFFGNIAPYKGLDVLVQALPELRSRLGAFRVLVVGGIKKGERDYFEHVNTMIEQLKVSDLIDQKIGYLEEEHVELYLKAADVLVLPYKRIFQSGVLFLAYSFGLPVVATDAGSLREEIIEGETGFICRRDDPADLAEQIARYFKSELFAGLAARRSWIINHANTNYSWERLAAKTRQIYEGTGA